MQRRLGGVFHAVDPDDLISAQFGNLLRRHASGLQSRADAERRDEALLPRVPRERFHRPRSATGLLLSIARSGLGE